MTLSPRLRSLLMGLVGGTGLVASALVFWLLRSDGGMAQGSGGPSLLDILDEVRRQKADPVPRRPSPPPPAQQAWQSPLGRACPRPDPALRQRLGNELVQLPGRMIRLSIHPTNYGERLSSDVNGNPIDPTPRMVVLHETVYGLRSAVNTFLTPHPRDDDQVSYHVLIGENGEVVQVVDPSKRAFGAGYSAFGGKWALTSRKVAGSVNNFALHLSLETPVDGEHEGPGHSGYKPAQYDALALVLADWMRRYPIPAAAITTHRHVDLGGERADPRSFRWEELQKRLTALGVIC